MKCSHAEIRDKTRIFSVVNFIHQCMVVLVREIRQENEIKHSQTGKEELKLYL